MWLTLILQNWRLLCGATLVGLLMAYGATMKFQRDSARHDLAQLQVKVAQAKAIADNYKQTTEKNLEVLQTSIPIMVDQAGITAVQNWRNRNPAPRAPACRVQDMPGNTPSADATHRSQGADAGQSDPVVDPAEQLAKACGQTTELYNQWRRWAELNKLPIQ